MRLRQALMRSCPPGRRTDPRGRTVQSMVRPTGRQSVPESRPRGLQTSSVSVLRATLVSMDVQAHEVEQIPPENLRVPRADFAAVWREAERLARSDKYAVGVAWACRWIACATEVFNGHRSPAPAPITHTTRRAHEELLEREFQAAERQAIRLQGVDHPDRLFIDGATATLRWAWKGIGSQPLGSPPIDALSARAG